MLKTSLTNMPKQQPVFYLIVSLYILQKNKIVTIKNTYLRHLLTKIYITLIRLRPKGEKLAKHNEGDTDKTLYHFTLS